MSSSSGFHPNIIWGDVPRRQQNDDDDDDVIDSFSRTSSSQFRGGKDVKIVSKLSEVVTQHVSTLIERLCEIKFSMIPHLSGNEKLKTSLDLGDVSPEEWKLLTTIPLLPFTESVIRECQVNCIRDAENSLSWDINIHLSHGINFHQSAAGFFVSDNGLSVIDRMDAALHLITSSQ